MQVRTTNSVLADIELYAALQRRGAIQNPDDLLALVAELRPRLDYSEDYHQATQSGIGLAKMALLRNNPTAALRHLQMASDKIDDAVLKHFPTSPSAETIRRYPDASIAKAVPHS